MDESESRYYARTARPLWEAIKTLAREKRHQPTPAENALWQRLRRNQLGVPFRRQHSIDRFIIDFYCPAAKLVIEVDGSIHDYTVEEDELRQAFLESLGLRVLRFNNGDVIQHMQGVMERIGEEINPSP